MWRQYLISPLCLKCGSLFCGDSLFCAACYRREILPRLEEENDSHVQGHRYLLRWPKHPTPSEDFVGEMVYRMKGRRGAAAWCLYSELLFLKIQPDFGFGCYRRLVPIPGSKQASVHARLLARCLALHTGLEVADVLQKSSVQEQKKLTADERRRGSPIHLGRPRTEDFTGTVLVDDVLTTGESARQSKKALGCGENTPILTLFYRPKEG